MLKVVTPPPLGTGILSRADLLTRVSFASEVTAVQQDFMIAIISDEIRTWVGYEFARQSYEEHVTASRSQGCLYGEMTILSLAPVETDGLALEIGTEATTEWTLDEARGILRRNSGTFPRTLYDGDGDPRAKVEYTAGYVLPAWVWGSDLGAAFDGWQADTVASVGQWLKPTYSTLWHECTAISGDFKSDPTTEPTWETTAGEDVVDDGITWTARVAYQLPKHVELYFVASILDRIDWSSGDQSYLQLGPFSERKEMAAAGAALPGAVRSGLSTYWRSL